ncbi:MAG: dipeptidase [Planctomycetes bacterium]|nr:dipeptidase [Planctomycetota bacterium]
MLDAVLQHLRDDDANALERLKQVLAIPSVSTDPAYAGHVKRAADWYANALRECGLNVKVHPTGGHPIVLAHTDPARVRDGAPRVLFYGHYDVQPPDPLNLWQTPPFEPAVRDGKIYARGAVDDKGQVNLFTESLRAWNTVTKQKGEKFPAHVTVLIEGEEECGSAHLRPFLESHLDELRADFVLISDTSLWEPGDGSAVPSICYGLRGLQYFDVQLHGPSRDLHSGVYGGTLANPATILTQVLGRLFDKKHRVTIPGFYDDVVKLTPAEKRRWKKLGFQEAKFLGEVGVKVPFGEAGFDTLARRWARPSCDINGLYGGYGGPGAKTVIPSFAGAKVSFRLAPNQSCTKIAAAFRAWLESQNVHGCRWVISDLHGADPVLSATDSPWINAASRACESSVGRKPVLVREGATIPVCIDFKKLLGLDCLLIGFGRNDDCIHSPNEKFNLDGFDLGKRTHAALLAELAKV